MIIPIKRLLLRAAAASMLAFLACWPASAHHGGDPLGAAAVAPAPGAPEERLTGVVQRVTIDDRVAGMVVTLYSVELDDGTAVPLKGVGPNALEAGARFEVTGRRNGKTLFVTGVRQLMAAPVGGAQFKTDPLVQRQGKLALLHADHFADGHSEFIFELHDAIGNATPLKFPVVPEAVHPGMHVVVSGRVAADGVALEPETVTVLELAPPQPFLQTDLAKAPTTNNVLVILMTFTDSPAVPFTQAQVQSAFAGGPGTGSVSQYFSEVSFGQQLINPIVTGWLPINAATPAGCNWQQMGTLGRNAASAVGYNVTSYQNLVYVFPSVGACGWAGLAYIGGNGVWINGRNTTSVYGHELGHNFGLLHAGSLRCSGVAIGGACSVSEYGDPFDIMGNQSMMHFNAPQKLDLGWIAPGTVLTHGAGSNTYVLNPIETASGAVYAVRIPVAANRTYWLEYRQPIGFDAGMASYPNNGAQVRVASPFETLCSGCDAWSNDTELLDMTPGTSTFTDAALVVGMSFADSTYGINISVLSATASGLTVQVTAPGGTTASSTTLASSVNPAIAGTSITFTATVTGSAPTGSVSFTDNGAAIAGCTSVALAGSGNVRTAACGTGSLTVGTHGIVATYGGNAGIAGSASAAFSQTINSPPPATTTTALATSANPATQGAAVLFTATVTGSAPTGIVGFTDNGSAIPGCSAVALVGSGNARTAACGASNLAIGNRSIVATYGGNAGNAGSASVALSQVINALTPSVVWVDDALPGGAVPAGDGEGWNWISANPTPFSGALAHQSALAAGMHQHYFYGATSTLPIGVGQTLYAYVYLDPANPPSQVMLQWRDGTSWEHRAYWGANNIGFGIDGTASRRSMGPLPATGQWVRLAVPAAQVGLDGQTLRGMAFTLYGGRATWDRAGTEAGTPTPNAWVDDALPAGAVPAGDGEGWNWTSTHPTPFSGALAHQSALAAGLHQHYFGGAASTLSVGVGDTLYAYVYLDPVNPPTQVMLQWRDGTSWEHRAYWGANNIGWGVDGTASRRSMGPLPATGQWVRLAVPAAQVGLAGQTLRGMAFTLYDGRATWDRAGIETGTPTATTTTLASALNPATVGVSVTFTATIIGTNPTGSVNFADGAASIAGCVPVALGGTGNIKTTTCSTSALAAGTHSIRVTYGGDANNTGSASTPLAQVVADPPAPAFTEKDAARLLQQGTWGATLDEIKRVARVGADAWLTEQFATPAASYTVYAEQNIAQNKLGANGCTGTNMQNGCPWQVNFPAFYKQAFEGSDPLRQRVANALLQVAVISIANGRISDAGTAMPNYLDMLGNHAFGNFRDLLKDITLHPGMGIYLDMLGSTLEVPNENYSRELLQLFSIGTVMLNDDGTPRTDAQGRTMATYDEGVVQGFAKAFTGWHFADQDTTKSWKFYWPDAKWTVPMQPWKARRCPQDGRWPAGSTTVWCDLSNPAKSYPPPHDGGTKSLLQYQGAPYSTLPAGQTPETDIENAIDNIFYHPNVGPFIVKQLIQRLVTSNPTPGYVQRVVRIFNNNGSNVRGDMKAVVRAILLDSEARSATVAAGNTFGKLREPVTKFLHLHRAFNARTSSGYYDIWDLSDPEDLGQAPLKAPSVFNFFGADFSPAGPIGQAGLVGPEFEILSTSVVSGFASFTNWAVVGGFGRYESDTGKWIKPDYDRYLVGTTGTPPLADNPQAMVDELDLLLTAGNLKPKFKSDLVAALNKVTRSVIADQRNDRFRIAMWQIIHSAEYAVQR